MTISLLTFMLFIFTNLTAQASVPIHDTRAYISNHLLELEGYVDYWTKHVERLQQRNPSFDLSHQTFNIANASNTGFIFSLLTIVNGTIEITFANKLGIGALNNKILKLSPVLFETESGRFELSEWACTTSIAPIYQYGISHNVFADLIAPLKNCEYDSELLQQ